MRDGPALTLDRGNGHAQGHLVALPRHNNRIQAALAHSEFLDRAGEIARRTGGRKLEDLLAHKNPDVNWISDRTTWLGEFSKPARGCQDISESSQQLSAVGFTASKMCTVLK